jgi:ribonucleoside-triphosphate reductase
MRTVSRIKKRDGDVVDFVQDKITNAVFNAMQAHGQEDKRVAQSISENSVDTLSRP